MKRIGLLLVVMSVAMPSRADADNTACTGAIYIVPDGSLHPGTLAAGSTERRWFTFQAKGNRSYAITLENMTPLDETNILDLRTFSDCNNSVLPNTASTWDFEPPTGALITRGDRRSFMTTADTAVYIAIEPALLASSFRIHVEETTLLSNWFFVGGDYFAFTVLRNTTSSLGPAAPVLGLHYRINWRNGFGTIIASTAGMLPPNSSVYKNGRDYPAVLAALSGTVEIVHDGPADAIVASTTVMSPTTGLSFDAPFIRRVR
jgi:hypothetical protein